MSERRPDRHSRPSESVSESEDSDSPAIKRHRGSMKSAVSVKSSARDVRSPPSSAGDSEEPSPKKTKSPSPKKTKSPKQRFARSRSPESSPRKPRDRDRDRDKNRDTSDKEKRKSRGENRHDLPSRDKRDKSQDREKTKITNRDKVEDKSPDKSRNASREKDKRSDKSPERSRKMDKKRDTSLEAKNTNVSPKEKRKADKSPTRDSKDRDKNKKRDDSSVRRRESDKDRGREERSKDKDRAKDKGKSDQEKVESKKDKDDSVRRKEKDRSGRSDRRGKHEYEKENSDRGARKRKAAEEETEGPEPPAEDTGADKSFLEAKRKKNSADDMLTTRTGGAYIPPARLRMMQESITDKASAAFQRLAWEALKKSINGLINKVNVSNIIHIVRELFQENIVRGRGLLCRSIIQAQAASPTFTHVYAALVAIINTKFPQIGELLLKRLALQFKKGYRRNDKALCLSSVRFVAHLVNQQVAHEILALEILTLLLENPTDDSVEVSIGILQECGLKLTEVSPRGILAIFERLRQVSYDPSLDKRVQYMIEVMFATRKDGFKDHPAVLEGLDLVEEEDQFTHMLTLEDAVNSEDLLNIFKLDTEYEQNEEKYKVLKKEILDEGSGDDSDGSGSSGSGSDSDSEEEDEESEAAKQVIIDNTEANLVSLRRIIYLTIQSSLDFEECVHKLLKTEIKPGQERELCSMVLDCCAQQRTYEKFFGLVAQRLCLLKREYMDPFQQIFGEQYETCHRLETNKLRNVAKFFAHLLHSDAISWEILQAIKLNEDDTTSSSRIFIKILFQELCEYMGLTKLNLRLKDETLQMFFEGLFPRDNPQNTRFAINFFTSIGLGGLTDELRAHLKSRTKTLMQQQQQEEEASDSSSNSSASSSSSSSSSSSDDSSDSDSSSDEDQRKGSKKKKKQSSKLASKQKERKKQKDKKKKPAKRKSSDLNTSEERLHKGRDRHGPEGRSSQLEAPPPEQPRKLSAIEERMKALAMPDVIPIEPSTLQPVQITEKRRKKKKKGKPAASSEDEMTPRMRSPESKPQKVISSRAAGMRDEIRELEKKLEDKRRNLETTVKHSKSKDKEETRHVSIDNSKPKRSPGSAPSNREVKREPRRSHHANSDEDEEDRRHQSVVKARTKEDRYIEREESNRSRNKKIDKQRVNYDRSEDRRNTSNNRNRMTSESDYEPDRSRNRHSESDYESERRGKGRKSDSDHGFDSQRKIPEFDRARKRGRNSESDNEPDRMQRPDYSSDRSRERPKNNPRTRKFSDSESEERPPKPNSRARKFSENDSDDAEPRRHKARDSPRDLNSSYEEGSRNRDRKRRSPERETVRQSRKRERTPEKRRR